MVFTLSWASFSHHPIVNCILVGSFVKEDPLPLGPLNLTWLSLVKFLLHLRWHFFISGLALSMYAQVLCDSLDLGSE